MTAHYLLARDTLDQPIDDLLRHKARTVDAVTDGLFAADATQVQDGLLSLLARQATPLGRAA